MIEIQDLKKSFGRFAALRGISFSIPAGSVTGFLGPNGAGKSTTMKILTSILAPTSGKAMVAGFDVSTHSAEVCRRIGYMPEQVALYPEMRTKEYLRYRASLKGLWGRARRTRVDEVMESCNITDVSRKLVGALSKGYRQRVALADVLVHDPEVLILDEPTSGLDPLQVIEVRKLIQRLGKDRTVLLSSHILGEVEQVCDQVIIIVDGRIRIQDSKIEWRNKLQQRLQFRLDLFESPLGVESELSSISGVTAVKREADTYEIDATRDVRRDVYETAVAKGWTLLELRTMRASLESLFVEAVSGETER